MIKVDNIYKYFSGNVALNGVSFEIEKGDVLAIVGDNGAGKSTLIKCINGIFKTDLGRIYLDNQDITSLSPLEIRKKGIQTIFQDLALCKQQDVVTNIFLGNEIEKNFFLDKEEMKNRCLEIFKRYALNFPLNTAVQTFSGGQQQSIAILRAIMFKPKLLIMDEPTSALSVKEVENVINQISQLKQEGVTVIIITHRLSDVFQVANKIVIMKHGIVVEQLKTSETNLIDLTTKILTK